MVVLEDGCVVPLSSSPKIPICVRCLGVLLLNVKLNVFVPPFWTMMGPLLLGDAAQLGAASLWSGYWTSALHRVLFRGIVIATSLAPDSGFLGDSIKDAALVDQWIHFLLSMRSLCTQTYHECYFLSDSEARAKPQLLLRPTTILGARLFRGTRSPENTLYTRVWTRVMRRAVD